MVLLVRSLNGKRTGLSVVSEKGIPSWYHAQPSRVLDTIDVGYMKPASEGNYDARYKTRVRDLSQNVYRNEDSASFGIHPCITPSGQPFISDAGRALAPEEALILQGIPRNNISFTTESPGELQDLAGNAMTTTVVAAAILSSFIVFGDRLTFKGSQHNGEARSSGTMKSTQIASANLKATKLVSGYEDIDFASLLQRARQAMRRCYCEGATGVSKDEIQECLDCGHTICLSCGGDPDHRYHHSQLHSRMRDPLHEFEAEIRSGLPLRIELRHVKRLSEMLSNTPDSDETSSYAKLVKQAAKEVFQLIDVRRRHSISAIYRSPKGRLELVLDDYGAEWHFYVQSPKELAANHELRQMLLTPVAKARLSRKLFNNPWKWRIPITSNIDVKIKADGEEIPTWWWTRMKLPKFRGHWQPKHLSISHSEQYTQKFERSVEGTYECLPRCSTACESLYRRVDANADQRPLYLFLDPNRVGPQQEDCFVFSEDIVDLEYDEVRRPLARIKAPWRPWNHAKSAEMVEVIVDDEWIELPKVGLLRPIETSLEISRPKDFALAKISAHCDQVTELIACRLTTDSSHGLDSQVHQSVDLNDSQFFDTYAWVLEAMRRHLPSGKWHTLANTCATELCTVCAPPLPIQKWRLGKNGQNVEPEEDTRSANIFDRLMHKRPAAIVIGTHSSSSSSSNSAQIRLGINLRSLAHRAHGRLPATADIVQSDWHLTTGSKSITNFSFRPFSLSGTTNVQPYTGNLEMPSLDDSFKQRVSLAWMRHQEAEKGK